MQRRAGDAARLEAAEQRSRSRGGARHEAGGGTLPRQSDRERTRERGRVGDRGTGGSAPALPAVNLLMHARIDLYLTFSSSLLSSLSLSLECRDSVVPCY